MYGCVICVRYVVLTLFSRVCMSHISPINPLSRLYHRIIPSPNNIYVTTTTVKDTNESMCPPGEVCERVTGWVSSLYEKAKGCCTKELSGVVDVDTCVDKSKNGGVLSDGFSGGTGNWYVDWIHQQCVRDCPVGSGSGCGGISSHNTWVELYTKVDDCCANLHYIEHPCVKTD